MEISSEIPQFTENEFGTEAALSSIQPTTTSERGEDQEDGYSRSRLGYIVLVAILMWGNVLVVTTNAKLPKSPSRLYMSALAVSDLIICANYIILRLNDEGAFGDDLFPIIDRLMEVFYVVPLIYSVLLLLIIAIDRYFAVCRPTSTFLRLDRVKKLLVAAAFVAAAIQATEELLVLFYRKDVGIYSGTLIWAASTLMLLAMYARIAVGLFQRAQAKRKIHAAAQPSLSASHSATPNTVSSTQETSLQPTILLRVTTLASSSMETADTAPVSSSSLPHTPRVVKVAKQGPQIEKMTKTGLMLSTVTLMFFVCWAPFWLHRAFNVNVPVILREAFIVNSLINPFIYMSLSNSFRENLLKSCKKSK